MQEKIRIPPERKPVSEFQTPSPTVVFFTELVNRTDPAYVQNAPVARGTLYSSIVGGSQDVAATYPNLYFVRERRFGQSDQLVLWDWATNPAAEDTYNSEATYVSNAVPYPAFTRVYTINRNSYDRSPTLAIGTPLTGLLGVFIVDPGQGYTAPIGTIDGTSVNIKFQVFQGQIISGVVTDEGTGITSSSVITITDSTGDGAVVTPIVQSTTCYLTSQKKQELAENDPLRNEYVRVIRTYETLPGPFIATTRIDEDGKVVTVNTRRNIAANITSQETLVGGQWCKTTKKGDDNFVGEEGVECRTVPGNPLVSTKVEEDGKILTITKTLKDTTLITSQEQIAGGNWVRTYKEEVSDLVANEIVESRPIPGNIILETRLDDAGNGIVVERHLIDVSSQVTSETVSGGHVWIKKYVKPVSDLVVWQYEEDLQLPGNLETSTKIDEDGKTITTTKRLQELSLITSSESVNGNWTRVFADAVSDLVAQEVTEFRPIPGNAIPYTRVDDDGKVVTGSRTLKKSSTITSTESLIAGTWTHTFKEKITDLVSWEVTESRDIPGNVITDTKLDDAGNPITDTRQMVDSTIIITSEALVGAIWRKKYGKSVSDLVSWQIQEDLTLPGNTITDTKLDKDGNEVTVTKFLQKESSIITSETIVGGATWRKKYGDAVSDLVSTQVQEDLTLPGNQVESTKFRSDGSIITILRTLKTTSSITPGGNIVGGVLSLTRIEEVSDLVAYEVIEQSLVPGPDVYGVHIDERYGLVVDITKTVVPNDPTFGPSPNPAADGTFYEVKPHDKWQSVQIASKFDASSLPGDVQWSSGMIYSFPPELTDAIIDWAAAFCSCSSSFSAELKANMKQYHGPVETRITEQFFATVDDLNSSPITITQFFPESHNFGYAWSSFCGTSDGNCVTKSGAPHFHIPLCLHDDLTLTLGTITFTFSATNPAALPHGSFIMLPPHIERWRFGVFRRVLTEVKVPS